MGQAAVGVARSGSGCESPSPDLTDTPGPRSTSYLLFISNAAGSPAPAGHHARSSPYWIGAGNRNCPGNSTSAGIGSTSLAPFPDAVALAGGSGRPGPAD